jgi:hypothetical protein
MQTISNLTFNGTVYSRADDLVAILHQIGGLSIFIPLPSANLIKFIHPFDTMRGCQNHIGRNNRKRFTLFAYITDMQEWLPTHMIRENLADIIIFCSSPDEQNYWKAWARRYTKKVREVIVHNDLDRDLLIFGLKYIKALHWHFRHLQNERQPLAEDYNEICSALHEDYNEICFALRDSFQAEINQQENYVRLGQEAI